MTLIESINRTRELAGMGPLTEEQGGKFLGVYNHGDGPSYEIFATAKEAYEFAKSGDYAEVIEFTGQLRSVKVSSRGDTIVNGDKGTNQIFHREDGQIYTDENSFEKAA